ncbi:conserved hypothetical protein [Perkinsus marinus ATCC 50983]|uniref:PDZ domain-containing protein n=1 Tax=Perkinsus marinus (strain ATCC 50983 / TXsc) TaxID=423536 RepID=C5LU25_PERM5|nr:conserved hypothetical protein [Perkinsus marinus ATCC 50983]EEQ99823.1 conserved hypothetical protein [Perkinsus marinus ATCC 50983]|eukprot:XP_002767106.1 conserved hypothetical protein [Perkinsus marinus ATCC 50983]
MAESPRPVSAVSLPRLVSASKHKAIPAPGVCKGTVKVLIEYCQRCYRHPWCAHHNEERYFTQFMDIAGRISQAFPEVGEIVAVKDPRVGALEVTVVHGPHQQVVFSKLQSDRWPNISKVLERIRRVVRRMVTSDAKDNMLIENEFLTPRHQTVGVNLSAEVPVPFVLGLEITDRAPFLVTVAQEGKYGAQCGVVRGDVLHCINGKACDRMDLDELLIELRKRPMSLYCRRFDHTRKARRPPGGPITFNRLFRGRPVSGRAEKAAAIHYQRQRMGMTTIDTIPSRPSPARPLAKSIRPLRHLNRAEEVHGPTIDAGHHPQSSSDTRSESVERGRRYDGSREHDKSQVAKQDGRDGVSERIEGASDARKGQSTSRAQDPPRLQVQSGSATVNEHAATVSGKAPGVKRAEGAKKREAGTPVAPVGMAGTDKAGRSAQKSASASKSSAANCKDGAERVGKITVDEANDYDEDFESDKESLDEEHREGQTPLAAVTTHQQSPPAPTGDAHVQPKPEGIRGPTDTTSITAITDEAQKAVADGSIRASKSPSSSDVGDVHASPVSDIESIDGDAKVETDFEAKEQSRPAEAAAEGRAIEEEEAALVSIHDDGNSRVVAEEKEQPTGAAGEAVTDLVAPREATDAPAGKDTSTSKTENNENSAGEPHEANTNLEGINGGMQLEDVGKNSHSERANEELASCDADMVAQQASDVTSPTAQVAPVEDDRGRVDDPKQPEETKDGYEDDFEEYIPSEDDVPEEPKANSMAREEEVWGGAGDSPRPAGEFELGARSSEGGGASSHLDVPNTTSPTKFREHTD